MRQKIFFSILIINPILLAFLAYSKITEGTLRLDIILMSGILSIIGLWLSTRESSKGNRQNRELLLINIKRAIYGLWIWTLIITIINYIRTGSILINRLVELSIASIILTMIIIFLRRHE
jgi:hypothetical protein